MSERESPKRQPSAADAGAARDKVDAAWHGSATVIALLFGFPESAPMEELGSRRAYFDYRTGDNWDLFFPGYFQPTPEQGLGKRDQVLASEAGNGWNFDPLAFNLMREHVEEHSGWEYSGETDLVLIGCYLVEEGEPIVDWDLTLSGNVTDSAMGTKTLNLGAVIENISRDLANAVEDPDWGVSRVVNPSKPEGMLPRLEREAFIKAVAGIAAALALKPLGL
ncbi:MAG TPA: hypothetical protein VF732_03365, partial [Nitrospira sp.]